MHFIFIIFLFVYYLTRFGKIIHIISLDFNLTILFLFCFTSFHLISSLYETDRIIQKKQESRYNSKS